MELGVKSLPGPDKYGFHATNERSIPFREEIHLYLINVAKERLMMSEKKPKRTCKLRLDRLLVDRGLAESRERAQVLIFAGQVLVNGQKREKAGMLVAEDAILRIIGEKPPFVSRGGLKLDAALKEFRITVEDKVALDVGASTGGFTDCLLQHGVKKVYAVDVGYGQMA